MLDTLDTWRRVHPELQQYRYRPDAISADARTSEQPTCRPASAASAVVVIV